jgi:hypothetical protein
MAPKIIAARVYLKPLLPDSFKGDVDLILKQTKNELLKRMRARIAGSAFSRRAKKALSKAVKVEVKPSSIVMTVNHPAFEPLINGQRKQKMKWLLKAKRPIPIITDDGQLIFRTASAKSMGTRNRWVHPGRPPSDLVETAKKDAREAIKAKLEKELRKQLRASWSR